MELGLQIKNQFLIISMVLITHMVAACHSSSTSVYASPTFANQQVTADLDPKSNHCLANQTNIPKSIANDIIGVTYSGNDQNIDLTLWLKDMIVLKNDSSLGGKPVTIFDDPPPVFKNGSLQGATRLLKEIATVYNLPKDNNQTHIVTNNGDSASLVIQKDPIMNSSLIDAKFELKSVPSQLLGRLLEALKSNHVNYAIHYIANTTIESVSKDYRMFIDINSIYDTGWDYVSVLNWNSTTDVWNYTMNQFGPVHLGQYKPIIPPTDISSTNLSEYLPLQKNFIDSKINMSDLNYPTDFRILLQMNNLIATTAGVNCEFYDRTDLIAVPPPKVDLNADPVSLDLLPGENAKILLTVNSSTDLEGSVEFKIKDDPEVSGIDIISGPSPKEVILPPWGLATSELEVRPTSANTTVLKPLANVSFSTSLSIGPYGNETSALTYLEKYFGIPITVKQPKGPIEQISEGLDNGTVLLSKMSGIVTAIGIIATGILGVLALMRKLGRGKSRAEPEKHSPI